MHEKNGIAEQCWKMLAQMKNSLLIDNELPIQFLARAMNTANYLQNRLPIKCIDKAVIILKEAQTKVKQNLKHIWIFGSEFSTHIFSEKHSKSNIHKI